MKKIVKIKENELRNIISESVKRILNEESYIDRMVNQRWLRFDSSKLKPIFDNLGLKRGGGGFVLGGDLGYMSFELDKPNVEFREYDNGKVFVLFGYDSNAGAWGGYTQKYEVKDPDIFKSPNWLRIIKSGSTKTQPDVIMINEDGNSINKKCSEYERVLRNEFIDAQKVINKASATFHNGIQGSLISNGYVVVSYGDNYVYFYGPSRLFRFYAHQDWNNYRKPWILTKKVTMNFDNYTWEELYQYPNYTHTRDYKEFNIEEFGNLYRILSDDIDAPVSIKPFKTGSEDVDRFHHFIVEDVCSGQYKTLKEFDNFQEAKEFAYKMADEECKNGKKRNDSTSRYYNMRPRDITKKHPHSLAVYEYYYYNEHSCYIAVEGD